MSLHQAFISSSVFQSCLTHAFSNEKEEIMGLLLGKWETENGKNFAHVKAISISSRLDKLKDRVEISSEQLMLAMNEGESLQLNVIGWYHSHPHLIVSPSTVDLRTQLNLQALDPRFFGIIFSCFNHEDNIQKLNITCFQALNDSCPGQLEIPLKITEEETYPDHSLYQISQLPNILYNEEKNSFVESLQHRNSNNLNSINNRSTYFHNSSIYMEAISEIIDKLSLPLYQNIETLNQNLKNEINELTTKKQKLLRNINTKP